MDPDTITAWLATLDSLSYYALFRVGQDATPDELRRAFHAFAEDFHPDVHLGRPQPEQIAIGYIFKRGTEAYRVLSDPQLRVRYDEALAGGVLRPASLLLDADHPRTGSIPPGGGRLVDQVRTPSARPFAVRVEELAKNGDPQQAKLQLVMAMHRDPGNPALEAYATVLEGSIKTKASAPKKAPRK